MYTSNYILAAGIANAPQGDHLVVVSTVVIYRSNPVVLYIRYCISMKTGIRDQTQYGIKMPFYVKVQNVRTIVKHWIYVCNIYIYI